MLTQEGVVKPQEGVVGEQPRLEFITSIPVHVCETLLEYLVSWPLETCKHSRRNHNTLSYLKMT